MDDSTRRIAVNLIDVAIWAVGLWLMTVPHDPMARAKMHWYVAATSRNCAVWFGRRAINAELRYMAEVKCQL